MNRLRGHPCPVAAMILGLSLLSFTAHAGGTMFGEDEDHDENVGPPYFGFVKDTDGNAIADAKVSVTIKDRGGVVTHSDALGLYKVPGFSVDVDPKNVEVSCEKEGYKPAGTFRRTLPGADPKTPIETQCTLQRG
ncbi:MAG TPA: carboxypeptidase-like regulatory domain-containing protein [Xanthobacteraceae bacterium]|nr:carboxypeptidase-like regulatory domain-containing protein [Xanthobacteraceae bacterium]